MMQEETHIVGGEMALRGMRKLAAGALRIVLAGLWFALVAQCALAVQTTLVADTVYLADGSVASGTVLIHWPAFTTAAGEAIPGGSTTVMVGADGGLRVALAPNAGATPEGVLHGDDAPEWRGVVDERQPRDDGILGRSGGGDDDAGRDTEQGDAGDARGPD